MSQTQTRPLFRIHKEWRPWLLWPVLSLIGFSPMITRAQEPVPIRWGFNPLIALSSISYSQDGNYLAIGGSGGATVYSVNGLPSWSPQSSIINCTSSVFSPDGKTLAVAGTVTGTTVAIELWSNATHKLLYNLQTASSGSAAIAFSPDSSTLAVGSTTVANLINTVGVLEEWNVETGKLVTSLKTLETIIVSLAYSPDGSTLADGGFDSKGGNVELWSVSKRASLKKLIPSGAATVTSVAFSRDGKTLALGGTAGHINGGFLQLWSVSSGNVLKALPTGNASTTTSLAFSPDGTKLADSGQSSFIGNLAIGTNGSVELWDLASGATIKTLGSVLGTANGIAFSPDGNSLAGALSNYTFYTGHQWGEFEPIQGFIAIWNVESQTLKLSASTGASAQYQSDNSPGGIAGGSPSISPNDKLVAGGPLLTLSLSGGIPVWNNQTGSLTAALDSKVNGGLYSTGFSPDSRLLAIIGSSYTGKASAPVGVLEIWNTVANTLAISMDTGVVSNGVVAFSPDGCVIPINSATDSNLIRPPIPIIFGHQFRGIRPPLLGWLFWLRLWALLTSR